MTCRPARSSSRDMTLRVTSFFRRRGPVDPSNVDVEKATESTPLLATVHPTYLLSGKGAEALHRAAPLDPFSQLLTILFNLTPEGPCPTSPLGLPLERKADQEGRQLELLIYLVLAIWWEASIVLVSINHPKIGLGMLVAPFVVGFVLHREFFALCDRLQSVGDRQESVVV
jgi:hypothetical protein